jgi:hypothetical protein
MQVIKNKTEEGNGDGRAVVVDYYEAARTAYIHGQYMRKYLDSEIKDADREINKCLGQYGSLHTE